MPQVSVVIPVFNCAHLIGRALGSVFAQTFQDVEVILVDDGSDDHDRLLGAIAPWRERIHYLRQQNGGPASARNAGIAAARGRLVAFLDADDEWMPGKLERQVAYFDRYPETGLLHTAVVGQVPEGAIAGPPRQAFCDLFHTVFFVQTLTVMVPRAVIEHVGGFDERREVHIEDWDLWLRIAARYPMGYLDEPLAVHHPGGLMSSQVDRTYEAQALVIEKNRALCSLACSTHRANPARCNRHRMHVLHRDWGYERLVAGDRKGARVLLSRALTSAPFDAKTAALYVATLMPARLRAVVRRLRSWLLAHPSESPSSAGPSRRSATPGPPSLVHNTFYRRARRRIIGHLHDLDDFFWQKGRDRKRVLFDAASPMSFAIFGPVYERLRRDPRLELWFTAHGRVWRPEDIFGPAGIGERVVAPSRAAWMKVDMYVNTDFWDMTWLHRRTHRVHLFHGVAGKYSLDAPFDLAPTIAAFDRLMFANQDRRQRYIEAGLVPEDDVKAALVGYPKVDRLVDGTIDRAAVAESLRLDPRIPTVIYAPTWSPYSSLNTLGEEIIDRTLSEGLQLIVKLHDRSYDLRVRGSGGIDWAQRLSRFAGHPRARIVRDADSSPFLVVSDLLITDHSSIAFEFMLLDRPLVIVNRPELIREAAVSADKVRLLHAAAHVVTSSSEIGPAVVRGLREPHHFSAVRRRTADALFYRAGTATDRAVELLYRLMELPVYAGARHPARVDGTSSRLRASHDREALPKAWRKSNRAGLRDGAPI